MSSTPASRAGVRRPKYYDLSLAHLPPPGLVSIFHRISGALLFFPILPLMLSVLEGALGSQEGFTRISTLAGRPGVKLILLACTWAYAHHFFAGIRYLVLDTHVGMGKAAARASALAVFAAGLATALVVAWRVW